MLQYGYKEPRRKQQLKKVNFAKTISRERKKKGLTQEELAAKLKITPQAVSKWENGVGYPDITLFPDIAEMLGIPISALFDRDDSPASRFPERFMDMPRVHMNNTAACYSNKEITTAEGEDVVFADGSRASLSAGTAENRGPGEIRLLVYEDCPQSFTGGGNGCTSYEEIFGKFLNLYITSSICCAIHIKRGGRAGCVRAEGSELFISKLDVRHEGESLYIEVKNHEGGNGADANGNRLEIETGFECGQKCWLMINGSSEVVCEPDFTEGIIKINGAGQISAAEFSRSEVKINGSGDIRLKAAGDTQVKINGSGSIICGSAGYFSGGINGSGKITTGRAAKSDISINGSGDVGIELPQGDISVSISGSGNIECGEGDIQRLSVSISGGGDINAKELTVCEAEIKAKGGGTIKIGRITGRSIEKLSKNSKLIVYKRG